MHDEKKYNTYWFHPDHLGSSSYISNLDGEISQHMEYFPFGETMVEEHLNSNNSPYKFNGKELDDETGNYYYGARYLNPKWSFWLSVDPLAEEAPGWTPYRYGFNNPIRYNDPLGMYENDDWIYDKQNDIYIWKEDINSSKDITDNNKYEYVGKNRSNIEDHYYENNNWFKRMFYKPKIDDNSYFSAKFNILSRKAINEEKNRKHIPLTEKEINENKHLPPDDQNEATYSIYSIDMNSMQIPKGHFNFKFSMEIYGETIKGDAGYSPTLPSLQYINNVQLGEYVPQGVFSGHYNYSLLLGNSQKTGVIIINFRNSEDYNVMKNYIHNK